MIENGRDEDVCRQWDALADEDHTTICPHKNITIARENLVADFKQDRFQYCANDAQT